MLYTTSGFPMTNGMEGMEAPMSLDLELYGISHVAKEDYKIHVTTFETVPTEPTDDIDDHTNKNNDEILSSEPTVTVAETTLEKSSEDNELSKTDAPEKVGGIGRDRPLLANSNFRKTETKESDDVVMPDKNVSVLSNTTLHGDKSLNISSSSSSTEKDHEDHSSEYDEMELRSNDENRKISEFTVANSTKDKNETSGVSIRSPIESALISVFLHFMAQHF
ncbi:hypothetical protein AB6A40_008937 [Gnathostoma spinigerum]|uniref:Uncharacterized protein n=1 Tax=Gnathostoma spinigerum TaxID=75299 RepID=A0ABD6EYS3_9BILA